MQRGVQRTAISVEKGSQMSRPCADPEGHIEADFVIEHLPFQCCQIRARRSSLQIEEGFFKLLPFTSWPLISRSRHAMSYEDRGYSAPAPLQLHRRQVV